jgi:mono/diheme cytochrome c family protein
MTLLAFSSCTRSDDPPDDPNLPANGLTGVTFLDQGWSEEVQQLFWFTSQGSQIIPYDWFLFLEQETRQELFRSDANIKPYGYIPTKPSQWNPDGLPVGFARDVDSGNGQHWMGFTCATCHTSQIDFKGTSMFIDGAPTLADFTTFLGDLTAAMSTTVKDDMKFDRFAKNVLGNGYSSVKAEALREALLKNTLLLLNRIKVNEAPNPYGHARLDAFGQILNQVMVVGLDEDVNIKPPNAPVSYPFLWGTDQSDVVQWNGSAPNIVIGGFPIGALARNIGEVLGVFGALDIKPRKILPPNYKSSVSKRNLLKLEEWVKALRAPKWPENMLPPIEPQKAANGQSLYQTHCVTCHSLVTDPDAKYNAEMTLISEVKTDPLMADNFIQRVGKTGILEGTPQTFLKKFGAEACGSAIVTNSVVGVILHKPLSSLLSARLDLSADTSLKTLSTELEDRATPDHASGYVEARGDPGQECFQPRSYKARPLNGIWATAPYLHNGSVPNLRQLLEQPPNRVKEFKVGSREFDPVNVGQVTDVGPSTLDTSIEGNSNSGHEYGTTLSDDEKAALVEYMKSL